jgi:hypothetical protein
LSQSLRNQLDSEGCIGRLACELGRMNSESEYKKPISWYVGRVKSDSKPKGTWFYCRFIEVQKARVAVAERLDQITFKLLRYLEIKRNWTVIREAGNHCC